MSFKVLIDDTIVILYASIKAGSWFLFKISALLANLFITSNLLNMHMTFDLHWLEESKDAWPGSGASNRLNKH